MGLDMYIDRRLKKYTDEDYKFAHSVEKRIRAYEHYKESLETLMKLSDDKMGYLDFMYPDIASDSLFKDTIFCGNGFYTGSKPVLFIEDKDNNPFYDPAVGADERYFWRVKNYTKEQIANLVYDNNLKEATFSIELYKEGPELNNLDAFIEENVAYWRKTNHIHAWLINNGTEKEEDYYCHISIDKLKELKDVCEYVLDDHSLADTLLPTQSGFFFGSTNYDEWYYRDLEDTIRILENIIDTHTDEYRYVYVASY